MIRSIPWLAVALVWSAQVLGAANPEDYPMAPEKVAPGVYAVLTPARDFPNPGNLGWNANMAFVVTGDGVLVVDTGSSETMGVALRNAIRLVTDQPVRWIVNTHSHGDHWLGNHGFAGARMKQQADGWIDSFNDMTGGATGQSRTLFPDRSVDERVERDLGGTRVVIPGHGRVEGPETLPRLKGYLTALWAAVEEGVLQGLPDFETVPIVRERMADIVIDYPGFEDKVNRSVAHMYAEVEDSVF